METTATYYPISPEDIRKLLPKMGATRVTRKYNVCRVEYDLDSAPNKKLIIHQESGSTLISVEESSSGIHRSPMVAPVTLKGCLAQEFARVFSDMGLRGGQIRDTQRETWIRKSLGRKNLYIYIEWWPGIYPFLILESEDGQGFADVEKELELPQKSTGKIEDIYKAEKGWSEKTFKDNKHISFWKYPSQKMTPLL